MSTRLTPDTAEKLKEELEKLNQSYLEVDGKLLNPGSCYYFDDNPPHVFYNTNCPGFLKEKIDEIILKYVVKNEGSSY